ncbi:MAG: hypothetical protein LBT10_08740 [Methanobrevibacter sp.]|nr:hypothetical protein [Methanobrevibacter sp.]
MRKSILFLQCHIKKGFNYRYTNYSGKEKVKAELTAHAVVQRISVIEVIETLV